MRRFGAGDYARAAPVGAARAARGRAGTLEVVLALADRGRRAAGGTAGGFDYAGWRQGDGGAAAYFAPGAGRAQGGAWEEVASVAPHGNALALLYVPAARGEEVWGAVRTVGAGAGRASRAEVRAEWAVTAPPAEEVSPPPPPPRTKWTRRVPHPVLIGHAASLT